MQVLPLLPDIVLSGHVVSVAHVTPLTFAPVMVAPLRDEPFENETLLRLALVRFD
jgi:hypothetical protein